MDLDFNDSIMTFDAPSPFDILEEDEVEEDCCEESRTEWLSNFFGEEPNLPLEAVEEASRAPVMSRCGSELLSFSRQNSDAQDVLPPEQLCFLGFTDSQCDSDEGFDFCETWFQEGKASVSKSNQCNHIAPKVQEQASENFASAVLKKTQRGLHVASNPQIQQTARDGQVKAEPDMLLVTSGQAHWAEKVKIMRREHAMLRVAELNRAFPRQIAEVRVFAGDVSVLTKVFQCCRLNLKSQKESLLLCLQRAVRDKVHPPAPPCAQPPPPLHPPLPCPLIQDLTQVFSANSTRQVCQPRRHEAKFSWVDSIHNPTWMR
eukprot:768170-Hanusia_phi.AAC.2